MSKPKTYFPNYIGQQHIVEHCDHLCNAIATGRNIPLKAHAYRGYAGLGKTKFAKTFASALSEAGEKSGGEFEFSEIPSDITMKSFLSHWANHIAGRRAVVLMDEASGLTRKPLKNLLKRILETENEVRKVDYEETSLIVNPRELQFIFATNEECPDSALFGPTSRTKELQFLPYTRDEVIALMHLMAKNVKLDLSDAAADYLADRVLPNGRAVNELIVTDCLVRGEKVTLEAAKEIVRATRRYPKGLRNADIKTLLFVGVDEKGKQVQEIASACGGEDKKSTSYRLQWLAGLNLIRTAANGRKVLTATGVEYMAALSKAAKNAKTAEAAVVAEVNEAKG